MAQGEALTKTVETGAKEESTKKHKTKKQVTEEREIEGKDLAESTTQRPTQVLHLVKEFYANLEEMIDDKVFVKGKWVDISSLAINKLIGSMKREEDDISVLMEEGLDTNERVK